jgi:hypothetical protein
MSQITEAHHELGKEVTKSRENAKNQKKKKNIIWWRLSGLVAAAPTQLASSWHI